MLVTTNSFKAVPYISRKALSILSLWLFSLLLLKLFQSLLLSLREKELNQSTYFLITILGAPKVYKSTFLNILSFIMSRYETAANPPPLPIPVMCYVQFLHSTFTFYFSKINQHIILERIPYAIERLLFYIFEGEDNKVEQLANIYCRSLVLYY